MVITYRRAGGLFMLLTLAAAALAAAVLTVVMAGILLIVAASVAAVALFGRAVLPRRWRHRPNSAVSPWPQETIDATVVATSASEKPKLLRLDDNTR